MNKISYGKGNVSIEASSAIRGFDIKFIGNIHANILLSQDWLVMSNSNRIIGLATTELVIDGVIDVMEYTGNLKIISCSISNGEGLLQARVENNATNRFDEYNATFSKTKNRPDELDANYTYKKKMSKTKIVQKNLITKEDEYYHKDGSKVLAGNEYHINSSTQQAILGPPGAPEDKKIYKLQEDGSAFEVRKIKYKPRRTIGKKMKAKYVKNIKDKQKASGGTRSPKVGSNPATTEGAAYTGGGSD